MILPCGVSSAPNRPSPGRSSVTSVVTRPLRKSRGIVAADLDHAPVGKKRCFHKEFSAKVPGETQAAGYHTRS